MDDMLVQCEIILSKSHGHRACSISSHIFVTFATTYFGGKNIERFFCKKLNIIAR